MKRPSPRLLLAVLWGVACFAFFQFCYPYHFFYKEQNQLFLCTSDHVLSYLGEAGGLGRLAGDFLTQYYFYLFAGATILTVTLLLLLWVSYAVLRSIGLKRWWALGTATLLATVETVFHLRHDFPLSATIALIGWLLLFLLALLITKRQQWFWRMALTVIVVPLAYWLFGTQLTGRLSMPDWYGERQLCVDSEYYFGNWDKVVETVEGDEKRTPEMLFFYNLVMAQRGKLPDVLLKYTPNTLGTFYKIGPETPLLTIRNMNELYYALGDMTFTERAAMMANVFSPNNRNNRMVKRLAECALVSGDTVASRKYLRMLERTSVWRQWALNAPTAVRYAEKARFANRQDTITTSDNAHFIMMQLLDSNPDNEVALDYILCSTLLLKDMDNFKRDYDRYCTERPRLKKLYQEALCIWLAGTNAPPEEWQQYIKDIKVLEHFQQYNQQRGSEAFKDTYWYYFDKVKAPQI